MPPVSTPTTSAPGVPPSSTRTDLPQSPVTGVGSSLVIDGRALPASFTTHCRGTRGSIVDVNLEDSANDLYGRLTAGGKILPASATQEPGPIMSIFMLSGSKFPAEWPDIIGSSRENAAPVRETSVAGGVLYEVEMTVSAMPDAMSNAGWQDITLVGRFLCTEFTR